MKKILSITMALVMLVSTFSIASFSAFAYPNKADAPEYVVGDTFSVEYDSLKVNLYEYYAKFVPQTTGFYEFKVLTGVDAIPGEVNVLLFDSKGNTVSSDYMDKDFPEAVTIAPKLTQGQTYYFAVQATACGTYKSDVVIKKHTHIVTKSTMQAMIYYDSRDTDFSFSNDGEVANVCEGCYNFETFEYGYYKKLSTIYAPKTITLSKTKYSYNGSAKTPSVTIKDRKGNVISKSNYTVKYSNNKKVGKALVTVDFKGDNYAGQMIKTFTINPTPTKITSISSKSKGFAIRWDKKTSQVDGYQVQYATNSKFTTNKKTETVTLNRVSSRTVSKLKPSKKYYVRIRTYKTVGKTKYYSSWSATKSITTKK